MDEVTRKYQSKIVIQFGNEQEQKSGVTKISQKLFDGTQGEGQDTTENALCFLENMEKTRNNFSHGMVQKTKKSSFYDDGESMEKASRATASRSGGSQSREEGHEGGYRSDSEASDYGEEEDVIIDLSPAKYENPKD